MSNMYNALCRSYDLTGAEEAVYTVSSRRLLLSETTNKMRMMPEGRTAENPVGIYANHCHDGNGECLAADPGALLGAVSRIIVASNGPSESLAVLESALWNKLPRGLYTPQYWRPAEARWTPVYLQVNRDGVQLGFEDDTAERHSFELWLPRKDSKVLETGTTFTLATPGVASVKTEVVVRITGESPCWLVVDEYKGLRSIRRLKFFAEPCEAAATDDDAGNALRHRVEITEFGTL